jgi:predicted N-acetyltransferase YhbS
MDDVRIRDLGEGDAETVSIVLRRGFGWLFEFQRKRGKDVQWLLDELSPDSIRESARKKGEDRKSIVAETDGMVVGYIAASYDRGPMLSALC